MGLETILLVLPFALKLVTNIEQAFEGYQGKGTVKKSIATDMLTTLFEGVASVSTGGQKATTDAIKPALGNLVEFAVSIMKIGSTAITGKSVIEDDGPSAADTARG